MTIFLQCSHMDNKTKPSCNHNKQNITTIYSKNAIYKWIQKLDPIRGEGGFSHGRSQVQAQDNPFGVIIRIQQFLSCPFEEMPFRGKITRRPSFHTQITHKQGMEWQVGAHTPYPFFPPLSMRGDSHQNGVQLSPSPHTPHRNQQEEKLKAKLKQQ